MQDLATYRPLDRISTTPRVSFLKNSHRKYVIMKYKDGNVDSSHQSDQQMKYVKTKQFTMCNIKE